MHEITVMLTKIKLQKQLRFLSVVSLLEIELPDSATKLHAGIEDSAY